MSLQERKYAVFKSSSPFYRWNTSVVHMIFPRLPQNKVWKPHEKQIMYLYLTDRRIYNTKDIDKSQFIFWFTSVKNASVPLHGKYESYILLYLTCAIIYASSSSCICTYVRAIESHIFTRGKRYYILKEKKKLDLFSGKIMHHAITRPSNSK